MGVDSGHTAMIQIGHFQHFFRDHSKLMSADISIFRKFLTPPPGHFFGGKNVRSAINVRAINVRKMSGPFLESGN